MGVLLSHPAVARTGVPLCVDLDGTLVRADTLHEQILALVRRRPFAFLAALLRLFQGIAAFKREIASRVTLNIETLPYNEGFLNYLRKEAAGGRRILLVTAADQMVAEPIARHVGLFEAILASDGVTNLKGKAKVAAIREYLGSDDFEYAGDSRADLPVWRASTAAILVNSPRALRSAVGKSGVLVTEEFPRQRTSILVMLRAIRVYQWSKNLLVFVPLFLSHKLRQPTEVILTLQAFFALSSAASALYIFNDLLDLESDRRHARKQRRPFASGALSVRAGIALAGLLLLASAVFTIGFPLSAKALVVCYVFVSAGYSAVFKRMLFLDITVLAGLYALRILLGGAATGIVISPWLLAFSIFLFISLAICKRLTELRQSRPADGELIAGRGYAPGDLSAILSLGSASGYVAVLVLGLYINSPDVVALYRQPRVLWLLCPVLAYWIGRMLILANRGYIHDDPVVFAFRDRASRAVALLSLLISLAAV